MTTVLLAVALATATAWDDDPQGSPPSWCDETAARLQLGASAPAPDAFTTLLVADLDTDGAQDVLVARRGAGDAWLRAEDGRLVDRTRERAPGLLAPGDTRALVVADLDGDGLLDVVVARADGLALQRGRAASGTIVWEHAEGALGWTAPRALRLADAAGADVTGDGLVDLYLVDDGGLQPDRLLVNQGGGVLADESWRLGSGASGAMHATCAAADVDADGDVDLIALAGPFGPRLLRLGINDGTGRFTRWQLLPFDHAASFALGDLDGDGLVDLYVVSDVQDYVLLQRPRASEAGDVAASALPAALAAGAESSALPAALAATGAGEPPRWLRRAVAAPRTARIGGRARVVDLQRDGRCEVGVADVDVWTGGCGGRFSVIGWCETQGAFAEPQAPAQVASGTQDVAWVDVDRDGRPDLLAATCSGYRLLMHRDP